MSGIIWFFLIFSSVAVFSHGSNLKMLMFGDKSSSNLVQDWCDKKKLMNSNNFHTTRNTSFALQLWGGDLSFDNQTQSTYCFDPNSNDLVAQIFIFGSNDNGPYFRHPVKEIEKNSNLIKTSDRIERGIKEFIAMFGSLPTSVVIHSTLMDYFYSCEKVLFNKIFDSSQAQWNEVFDKILVDFKTFDDKSSKWKDIVTAFETNTIGRIDHLRGVLKAAIADSANPEAVTSSAVENVEIQLHTAVWFDSGAKLLSEFNHIVRNVSAQQNLTYFDLDYSVWSKANFKYTQQNEAAIVRDKFFPQSRYSEATVDVLLGKQFDSYYYYHNKKAHDGLKSMAGVENINIRLIRAHASGHNKDSLPGTGEVFFCNFVDGVRTKWRIGDHAAMFAADLADAVVSTEAASLTHGAPKNPFYSSEKYERFMRETMESMFMGASEMLMFPDHVVDALPLGEGFFPILFSDTHNIGFTVRNKEDKDKMDLFISYRATGKYKQIPYEALYQTYEVAPADIARDISPRWLEGLPGVDRSGVDIYMDDTLLRLVSERSVYVIKHGMKYSFSGAAAFYALGYDFDNVVVLSSPKDKAYFDMIPNGGKIA